MAGAFPHVLPPATTVSQAPALATNLPATATADPPSRAVTCPDAETDAEVPIADSEVTDCELAAIVMLSLPPLFKTLFKSPVSTRLATSRATMTPATGSRASAVPTAVATPGAFVIPAPITSDAQARLASRGVATPSSKPSAKMVSTIIIVGLVLLTFTVCFWLFLRYRKATAGLGAPSVSRPSPWRKLKSLLSDMRERSTWFRQQVPQSQDAPLRRHKYKRSDAENTPRINDTVARNNLRLDPTQHPSRAKLGFEGQNSQRQTFEDRYHAIGNQRTILAELDGSAIISPLDRALPPLPSADRSSVSSEVRRLTVELDRALEFTFFRSGSYAQRTIHSSSSYYGDCDKRLTQASLESYRQADEAAERRQLPIAVLSHGMRGRVIKGDELATVVDVKKKRPEASSLTLSPETWQDVEPPPTLTPSSETGTFGQPSGLGMDSRVREPWARQEPRSVLSSRDLVLRERRIRMERRRRKRNKLLSEGVGGSYSSYRSCSSGLGRGCLVEEEESAFETQASSNSFRFP